MQTTMQLDWYDSGAPSPHSSVPTRLSWPTAMEAYSTRATKLRSLVTLLLFLEPCQEVAIACEA